MSVITGLLTVLHEVSPLQKDVQKEEDAAVLALERWPYSHRNRQGLQCSRNQTLTCAANNLLMLYTVNSDSLGTVRSAVFKLYAG
jgi:hypothetical protein